MDLVSEAVAAESGMLKTRLDELHERVAGALVGNAALDDFLADVQIDLAGRATHVAEVCVCHLARAVHNAAHDRNGHTCEAAAAA